MITNNKQIRTLVNSIIASIYSFFNKDSIATINQKKEKNSKSF